jgi:hypothetical protein
MRTVGWVDFELFFFIFEPFCDEKKMVSDLDENLTVDFFNYSKIFLFYSYSVLLKMYCI